MAGRPANIFAEVKSDKQREELRAMWKEHPHHFCRIRAHAILLSDDGFQVESLSKIFSVTRDTARSWITRFQERGVDGLEDEEKLGGPRILDESEEKELRSLIEKYPSEPRKVIAELKELTGKTISRDTLRRYAHRFNLRWKRMRKSLRKRRDERAFRDAQDELAEMLDEPTLRVVFFDEAGFSLKGVVPYGWQPIGERQEIPVSGAHSSGIQALGFADEQGMSHTYLHKGTVNSQTVIEVLDDFSTTITGETVVVLDNASCHASAAFNACIDRWAERGLYIYHLPPYSPELNSIESWWKKIKYQLLPSAAWERFTSLLNHLTLKLKEIGEVVYMPSLWNYTQ